MQMKDYIVIGIILIGVIAAVVYMVKQKKKGKRIGCGSCGGKCAECTGKHPKK